MFRPVPALVAFGLSLGAAAGAHAGPCGDEVARLADTFGISTVLPESMPEGSSAPVPETPPATVESRGLLGTDNVAPPLAESGGVMEPPDVGRTPVIEPPAVDEAMPTAPAPDGAGSEVMAAEERQRAASLLTAAREADEDGKAEACREHLEDAKKFLPLR